MSLVEYAKNQIDIRLKNIEEKHGTKSDDYTIEKLVCDNALELIEVFSKQGHSGSSAPYVLNIFRRLANFLPLQEITGAEEEWGEGMSFGGEITQQNKLCSSIFRDNYDNSTARNIDDKVYSDNGGHTWFSTGRFGRDIITFPYYPPIEPEFIYLDEDGENVITDKDEIKKIYDNWKVKYE